MKKLLGVLLAAVCLFSTAALAAAAESLPGAASGDQATEGAAAYDGRSNAAHSPYFNKLDFYNEHSNERGLSVVSGFRTYQQTTESTCGPSCALMVLELGEEIPAELYEAVARILAFIYKLDKGEKP